MSEVSRYWRAPEADMNLFPGSRACFFCGQVGPGFDLGDTIGSSPVGEDRDGKAGCLGCLRLDRFGFSHVTNAGFLGEEGWVVFEDEVETPGRVFTVSAVGEAVASAVPKPPRPVVSEESIAELRRTPTFLSWQDQGWQVHCNDFMAFLGIWGLDDFAGQAADGEGRALFLEMASDYRQLWREGEPPHFDANFVIFECLHCGVRTATGDFD